MSDGALAGYAETVALNAQDAAIVAARRGAAWLRFPGECDIAPIPLTAEFVEALSIGWLAAPADVTTFSMRVLGTRGVSRIDIDRDRHEPLIAALRRAVRFGEGLA